MNAMQNTFRPLALKFPGVSALMLAGTSRALTTLASACVCIVSMLTCNSTAGADRYSESAVKAAYLYRFTAYIDWPLDSRTSRFTIAVLGDDDVADDLGNFLSTRSIKNLPSQVRKIKKPAEMGDAQMLYIGPSFKGDLRQTIASVNSHPVLIITSQIDALDAGSAINFLEVDNRIRFEASIAAVERPGMRIAPELLSVAVRVASNRPRRDNNCRITKTPALLNTHCTEGATP